MTRIVNGMNVGAGDSAKKANTVAMEGNMRFGWLMKITSLRLAIMIQKRRSELIQTAPVF